MIAISRDNHDAQSEGDVVEVPLSPSGERPPPTYTSETQTILALIKDCQGITNTESLFAFFHVQNTGSEGSNPNDDFGDHERSAAEYSEPRPAIWLLEVDKTTQRGMKAYNALLELQNIAFMDTLNIHLRKDHGSRTPAARTASGLIGNSARST